MISQPFAPHYGSNRTVAASTVAATTPFTTTGKQVRILNSGPGKVYVRSFRAEDGVQAATSADYPVQAGQSSIITRSSGHNAFSLLATADATTVDITGGDGY